MRGRGPAVQPRDPGGEIGEETEEKVERCLEKTGNEHELVPPERESRAETHGLNEKSRRKRTKRGDKKG